MSVKYEIQKTIFQNVVDQMSQKHKDANNIPDGRKKAKKMGVADRYIYSYGTAKKVMSVMNHLAKFSGVTNINQLRKKHTDAYMKDSINRGLDKDTLVTRRFAIRKFEKCMIYTGKKSKHADSFAPTVELPKENRINPRGRYTQEEYETIISELKDDFSPEIVKAVEIQNALGLRINEALNITTNDINLAEIIISNNIAKGGKDRKVPVFNKEHPLIISILANHDYDDKDKVVDIGERRIQQAIREVCLENGIKPRGSHGFRGKFANERLKYYCQKHGVKYDLKHLRDDPEASLTKEEKGVLMMVSKDLGHERISVIRNYYLHR